MYCMHPNSLRFSNTAFLTLTHCISLLVGGVSKLTQYSTGNGSELFVKKLTQIAEKKLNKILIHLPTD